MNKQQHPYKRAITHDRYPSKKWKYEDRMQGKGVRMMVTPLTQEDLKRNIGYLEINDKYIIQEVHLNDGIFMGGGLFLFLSLGTLLIAIIKNVLVWDTFGIIYLSITFSGFLFFVVLYFTQPKKESIFNREDGLITIPGFLWSPNVTMRVEDIQFIRTSHRGSAIMLGMKRPYKIPLPYSVVYGSQGIYDEMLSFYLWYLDRNRPLPPGSAFDPYREEDYARRKAEGFPKPIFMGIDTPEATEAQQKEREEIGGW